MTPLVSIVLPVRNAAATVDRAIVSLVAQTLPDWELLVVDDGSTDATPGQLAAWGARERRLRVVRQPALGLVAALTRGLAVARGEVVARMDADDEADPERLERQVAALRADPSLGVVGCQVRFGGDRTAQAGYARHVDWLNALLTPEQIALHRFVESPFAHPSVMFRRALVSQQGGYREGDFPEDYELWLRWLDAGVRMAKVPAELLTWHDSPGRLSRTDRRYDAGAFYRIKAVYLARWLRRRWSGPGEPPPLWVWGAGRPTRKRVAWLLAEGVSVAAFIDVDPKKIGGRVGAGLPVVAPTQLPEPGRVFVLAYVSSRGARELIQATLEQKGYVAGRDYLLCA